VSLAETPPDGRTVLGPNRDGLTATAVISEYRTQMIRMSALTAARLRTEVGKRLDVVKADHGDEWNVTAGSHVGTVVVPGLQLFIRPKVTNANLFHLLGVDRVSVDVRHETYDYGQAELLPAFAAFYAHQLDAALARGVAREYVEEEERLIAIRGRIDIAAQTRQGGLPVPVACRFDDHTEDIALNRTVRAAAVVLLRLPGVGARAQRDLVGLLDRLDGVRDLLPGDLLRDHRFTRLDQHYEVVEALARMVLASASIDEIRGGRGSSAFLINMNKVFERFVEARLARALSGRLTVVGQERHRLGAGHTVHFRPDLVFRRAGRIAYVGDAKYKLTKTGGGEEADYYQLLAYATALDVPEGVLVYARDSAAATTTELTVHHSSKHLRTWPVSLDGAPDEIDAQLDQLGDHIVSWSTPA